MKIIKISVMNLSCEVLFICRFDFLDSLCFVYCFRNFLVVVKMFLFFWLLYEYMLMLMII